jgi:hypothetical protein
VHPVRHCDRLFHVVAAADDAAAAKTMSTVKRCPDSHIITSAASVGGDAPTATHACMRLKKGKRTTS